MADAAPPVRSVLMTADTGGGVFTYAVELASVLSGHGVGVVLATMGAPATEAQRAAIRRMPLVELVESSHRLEWTDDPWDDVQRAGEWLLGLEERFEPDVVHLNGYCHGAIGWRAPTVMVAHSCVVSWWRAVHGADAPPSWDRYRAEVTRGLRAATAVVAPTRAMLSATIASYGVAEAGHVISNAASARRLRPAKKEPIVLSAGRIWDAAKNVRAVADVAPELPWPVMVAGSDTHPAGGTRPLPHVRSLGWLESPELSSWLARASIYALPARYEPFGLSILEAALSGCALVVGDIPSLREVWEDAAHYVPPDDRDALARTLRGLIADDDARAAMADRARRRALTFSPARMGRRYLALYRDLVKTRTRRDAPASLSPLPPCA